MNLLKIVIPLAIIGVLCCHVASHGHSHDEPSEPASFKYSKEANTAIPAEGPKKTDHGHSHGAGHQHHGHSHDAKDHHGHSHGADQQHGHSHGHRDAGEGEKRRFESKPGTYSSESNSKQG